MNNNNNDNSKLLLLKLVRRMTAEINALKTRLQRQELENTQHQLEKDDLQ